MCEKLTSCGVKITEPFSLVIHTINSHSKTWTALKLEREPNRCEYREMEWKEGREQPEIRWRAAAACWRATHAGAWARTADGAEARACISVCFCEDN